MVITAVGVEQGAFHVGWQIQVVNKIGASVLVVSFMDMLNYKLP